jgi:hypothetical protein
MIEVETGGTDTAAIVHRAALALTKETSLVFPRSAVGTTQPFRVKMFFNPSDTGFVA